jgi:hypothetical protein
MIAALSLVLSLAADPGLAVGEAVSPFEPYWVSGPYAETRQCPVCEYGALPLVIVWSQFKDPAKLEPIVRAVDVTVKKAPDGRQKAFLVDLNEKLGDAKSSARLKTLADKWKTPNVFYMSRLVTARAPQKDYKLMPYSDWETIIYVAKNRMVTAKFVNPTVEQIPAITEAIQATTR